MPQEEKVAASSSSGSSSSGSSVQVRSGSSLGQARSGRCDRIHRSAIGLTKEQLEQCVDGFSQENFIGKFQFGEVYRGKHAREDVIVKIWKHESFPGENHGRLEDEILLHEYFSMYEFHPNVPKLFEFCQDGKYPAAIYYLNPQAIDTLHNLIEKDTLSWKQRIKVAFGFASLLRYMHTPHPNSPSDLPYLIRNIDAAHILVDEDHEPLLFDFSMISGGFFTDKRDLLNQHIEGCYGYSDPFFAQPGEWSDKCDVFSFGVLLLSLISKRMYKVDGDRTNVPFVYEWAKIAFPGNSKSSLVHHCLELDSDFHLSDGRMITRLAMECIEYDPQKRPTMKQVIKRMKKLHIVRHNANAWECYKMLDGVNEVRKTLMPYTRRPGRLPFIPLKKGTPKKRGSGQSQTRFRSSIGVNYAIEVFSYEDLSKYTGGFSIENFIGEFQFGKIFRGIIKEKKVIVKIWETNRPWNIFLSDNKDRLKDEISLLQHPKLLNHPNLVKMIGYCCEEKTLGAVYDLDPLDSLQNLARKDEFTWLQRMKVINEFANLLEFLHAANPPYAPYRVGNIDAAHIILDKEYSPKLLDFGMTIGGIILSLRESRNCFFVGCFGYIDPGKRCFHEQPDVFAFGILLLCLISKRIPRKDDPNVDVDGIFLANIWAWDEYEKWLEDGSAESGFSLVHEDLREEGGFDPQDGVILTKLGLECVDRSSRSPSMDEIAERLRQLRVMGVHAEEKLAYRSNNAKFKGINCLTGAIFNFGCIDAMQVSHHWLSKSST